MGGWGRGEPPPPPRRQGRCPSLRVWHSPAPVLRPLSPVLAGPRCQPALRPLALTLEATPAEPPSTFGSRAGDLGVPPGPAQAG